MSRSAARPSEEARPIALRSVDRAIERRRASYEEEVRRLVAASFKLIQRHGSLEPRVGEIVAEAGLSNQAFYKHFKSKDELLLAVLDEGVRTLRSYLEHRMVKARSPESRVRTWIAGILEQALNPDAAPATRPFALSRVRLSERFSQEVQQSEKQLTALLRGAIEEAVETGVLGSADPERDADLVYHLTMGWLERRLADPAPARRADAEHLVEFAMRGLRRDDDA